MLKVYVSQADLSDGYVLSESHMKRPNKTKIKAKIQKQLNKLGYGDKVLSVVIHKIDLMEVIREKKVSIS